MGINENQLTFDEIMRNLDWALRWYLVYNPIREQFEATIYYEDVGGEYRTDFYLPDEFLASADAWVLASEIVKRAEDAKAESMAFYRETGRIPNES